MLEVLFHHYEASMKKRRSILILILAACGIPAHAEVQLSPLFSDHMVIQRESTAPVWGMADAGERVTVVASWGEEASGVAGDDGKWMVQLQTPEAGGPHSITVTGKNTVVLQDVLSGEVWFCSGQSNMDYTMQWLSAANPDRAAAEDVLTAQYIHQELNSASDSQLRQFEVQKKTAPFGPQESLKGSWVASTPEANGGFSATAYFFARELREQLQVPVGIIKCAWGGTRVEPWMPHDAFEQDPEMLEYYEAKLEGMKKGIEDWDAVEQKQNYEQALAAWKETKQGRKPQMPVYPMADKQSPATLFNGMVFAVKPFAIRGVIWYQGESNAKHQIAQYGANLTRMVSSWRSHWGQGEFPFYLAQLANFRAPSQKPLEFDPWASIQDQQRRFMKLENTGMAVLNDIGENNDIHPHNKIDVGKRLALWALKHDYGMDDIVASGPLYESHSVQGAEMLIRFSSVGQGLMVGEKVGMQDTRPIEAALGHFQICGEDGRWHWAAAEIISKDTIKVSHPEVRHPVEVRYAWSKNPTSANLYNKSGLPASLFTTNPDVVYEKVVLE